MSFHSPLHAEAATSHGDFSTNQSSNAHAFRIQQCEGQMPTVRYKKTGNLSASDTKPRAFVLTQREWRLLSQNAFREHTKGKAKPARVIADDLDCSPKTAQSWLDGESTPAGLLDKRAFARIPAYNALVREITAMEADLDPRLQAKYQELHRLTLELANGGVE